MPAGAMTQQVPGSSRRPDIPGYRCSAQRTRCHQVTRRYDGRHYDESLHRPHSLGRRRHSRFPDWVSTRSCDPSLADDLDDEPLVAPAVELRVEDLLPGTEVEAPLRHRHDRLVVHEQVLQVSVAVVLAAPVVAVLAGVGKELARDVVGGRLPGRRSELVEPLERLVMPPGLVGVHPHAGGYGHAGD